MDVLRVSDDPVQRAHPSPARPEGVHRAETRRLDDAVVVLGVGLGSELAPGRAGAPIHTPRVVGDHGTVTEVAHQLLESGRPHRRAEDEQRPVVAGLLRFAHVVGQHGAGNVEGMGGRLGQRCSSRWCLLNRPARACKLIVDLCDGWTHSSCFRTLAGLSTRLLPGCRVGRPAAAGAARAFAAPIRDCRSSASTKSGALAVPAHWPEIHQNEGGRSPAQRERRLCKAALRAITNPGPPRDRDARKALVPQRYGC